MEAGSQQEMPRNCHKLLGQQAGGWRERGTCHCKDIRSGMPCKNWQKAAPHPGSTTTKGPKRRKRRRGHSRGGGAADGGREVSQQLLLMLPLPTYVLPKCCHKFWGAATTTRHTNKESERREEGEGRGRQTKCKETMCSAKQQHNKGNECGCLASMAATRQVEKDRERKRKRRGSGRGNVA